MVADAVAEGLIARSGAAAAAEVASREPDDEFDVLHRAAASAPQGAMSTIDVDRLIAAAHSHQDDGRRHG